MTLRLLRFAVMLASLAPIAVLAQTERQAAEIRIKAAFLYRFSGYVEWPPNAFARQESPFVIGVSGAEALAEELEKAVAGRDVQGRAVVVRRIRRAEALAGVHMLFVGRADTSRLPDILAATRDHSVLTVTESDGAIDQGSMINFVEVDNKVRFDVALPQIERANLRVSARLLAVARKVVPMPS